tara:strand:+ start:431 stop:568 length:138 start_codon:yes stop_codon:yes gene_type:complete
VRDNNHEEDRQGDGIPPAGLTETGDQLSDAVVPEPLANKSVDEEL